MGLAVSFAMAAVILPESGEETRVLFSRELDHAHLRDHDRPAEDRADSEKQQDKFARERGVIEREKQTAGCNQIRNEHFRITCRK